MRFFSPDGTTIGLHDDCGKFQAMENLAIGVDGFMVDFIQFCLASTEAITIHHHKFPGPDDAPPGTNLISELGLDLI